jgi:hypothetical protein
MNTKRGKKISSSVAGRVSESMAGYLYVKV